MDVLLDSGEIKINFKHIKRLYCRAVQVEGVDIPEVERISKELYTVVLSDHKGRTYTTHAEDLSYALFSAMLKFMYKVPGLAGWSLLSEDGSLPPIVLEQLMANGASHA